jgi:NAD-reducing hydrogenase large subunit
MQQTETPQQTRKIVIDPITRVEGHGKVTLHLNEANEVEEARFHVVEFRGFERFIQGRMYWEAPVIIQRLCGICPVSHHLAAAKAMDMVVGVKELTPTAEKMRRLMHYGQIFQSHALHFFHLCSPDLLFGFDAPVGIRNVIGVMQEYPDLGKQAILMRKYGQEVIGATGGRKIHPTSAIPGGINKNLSIEERDALRRDIDQMIEWCDDAIAVCINFVCEKKELCKQFAAFPSNHLSLVGDDGRMDLYDGKLKAIDAEGKTIFTDIEVTKYRDHIIEEIRPWSYMKFPHISSLGKDNGWYRVGPLAEINCCDFIDTPLAETARKAFLADANPNNATLGYHQARLICMLHAAEKIKEYLFDDDLQGNDLLVQGERQREGIAVVEAPRGTLFHHYEVNEDDQIVRANLIVSTTNNNEAINQAVKHVARKYISGKQEITEGLLNHIEVAIRAYDPCLSCATHALGQMPLVVTLEDAAGEIIAQRAKD